MFGIGMNEFLLLVLLALVLIGPKQLPEVARGLGKLLATFRRATSDLRNVVSQEINSRPEYRDLLKMRDEIAGDVRAAGDRARKYVDDEFREEQSIAGAVERDVQKLGSKVQDDIRGAAQDPAHAGAPPEGMQKTVGAWPVPSEPAEATAGAELPQAEEAAPADRAEFDKAYRSFYTTEPGSTAPASADAPQAESPAAASAPAQPAEGISPEDQHLREQETARAGALRKAEEEGKAGMLLLRRGGRGGPYTFAPELPKTAETGADKHSGGDKA